MGKNVLIIHSYVDSIVVMLSLKQYDVRVEATYVSS
jgi:hypothetical protein